MSIIIKIEGADKVMAQLAKADVRVREGADQIVQRGALLCERIAKQLCPVDTGRLRNSIRSQKTGFGKAEVSDGVNYGVYVEFGTSKMGAQPFLRPAAESVQATMEEEAAILLNTSFK